MESRIPSRDEIKDKMKEEHFDVIIIGGGITGACAARDASLRGLKVCLLEKRDFASGTSSMTSKMIHGGLRYLQNFEFRLVREAALERKVAIETAPHLAETMKFMVPLYKWNRETPFIFRLGLMMYYFLAFPKQIGKYKILGSKKIVEAVPLLANDLIKGGASYYDVKTDDSRLTLENILQAIHAGAKVLNYVEVTEWVDKGDEVTVKAVDALTGEEYNLIGDSIIISGGPWTDHIEKRGENFKGEAKLRLTRGSHLMIDKKIDLPYSCLLVNHDDRPVFIVPRINNKILAGTTDVDYDGHPDDIAPNREDVDYILKACNEIFPTVGFKEEDVVSIFTGVRPLVYKKGVKEGKISRDHVIYQQNSVVTVLGGKLTTARVMAKQVVDKIIKKVLLLPIKEYKCLTHKLPLYGGEIDDWNEFYKDNTNRLLEEYNLNDQTADMLVRWYGSELEFFEIILKEHGNAILIANSPWLEAQVIYSCRVECVQKPIDFLRRRTPIMLERDNGLQCLDVVANLMSKELHWDDKTKKNMIIETKEYIKTFVAVPK